MDKLHVCFVGIGSIAKRHISNLKKICVEKKIEVSIDALRIAKKELPKEIADSINEVYTSYDDLPNEYDVIFITNPTEYHIDTLKKVHNHARHFFIEKPITSFEKRNEVFELEFKKDVVYYVACPLRYTNVIQYIKQNVDVSRVRSVRCISSSYLPEWRPGVDYRDTYSAHKDLGGGVSIDLIHEWDYLHYLFGEPDSILFDKGKKSNLEIDCEDYAVYIAKYADKIVELHLDYFGRNTIREIMMITDEDTIVGDLVNSKVSYLKSGETIDFSEKRNDFQTKELMHFLDLIEGKGENAIMEAYKTLGYTQGVLE